MAFSPPSTMNSTCSFCPRVFASELELFKHVSTCSVKMTCSIALPSRSVTANGNSNNQWPCYCDWSKCRNKIFTTLNNSILVVQPNSILMVVPPELC